MNTGAGKGDRPRPVDPKKYAEGWERAFGKNKKPRQPLSDFIQQNAKELVARGFLKSHQ